jgi:hypothetical protein
MSQPGFVFSFTHRDSKFDPKTRQGKMFHAYESWKHNIPQKEIYGPEYPLHPKPDVRGDPHSRSNDYGT